MPLTELLRTLLFSFTFILLTRVFTVFFLATALSFPKSKQQWNPQGVAPTAHDPGRILPGISLYRI